MKRKLLLALVQIVVLSFITLFLSVVILWFVI